MINSSLAIQTQFNVVFVTIGATLSHAAQYFRQSRERMSRA